MDYLGNDRYRSGAQKLQNALDRNIQRLGTRHLLVHLGLAFFRFPVEFLSAVLDARLLHPQLSIGLDKGLPYAIQHLQLFVTPGPAYTSLLRRLIQNQSAFDTDNETAALASCLY